MFILFELFLNMNIYVIRMIYTVEAPVVCFDLSHVLGLLSSFPGYEYPFLLFAMKLVTSIPHRLSRKTKTYTYIYFFDKYMRTLLLGFIKARHKHVSLASCCHEYFYCAHLYFKFW